MSEPEARVWPHEMSARDPGRLYGVTTRERTDPHGEPMDAAPDLSSTGLRHAERNAMSTLVHRAAATYLWRDLPLTCASKFFFLLGQNARGMWIIRESTGQKAGMFRSREAALRFARLEGPDDFAVVHVN